MNIKILGLGAAGNKAAITAIEQGVVEKKMYYYLIVL